MRPLTLLDVMILVAATGVGFHFCRASMDRQLVETKSWTTINLASFVAASWTISVLAIRLVPPRPGFRRLMRQPGTVACLIVAIVIAVKALYCGVIGAVAPPIKPNWFETLALQSGSFGAAVCVAWLMLLLSGRRLPEPSWIDRLGRALGAYWIILLAITSWFNARDFAGSQLPPWPVVLGGPVPASGYILPSEVPPAPGALPGPLPPGPPVMIDVFPDDEQFSVARRQSGVKASEWFPGIPGPPQGPTEPSEHPRAVAAP
jgi:hypothetical protein